MSDAVFCCEKKSMCQWQCFALHQGLGWGEVPKLTENSWREWHDKMCGGKLIQLVPRRIPDADDRDTAKIDDQAERLRKMREAVDSEPKEAIE